MPCQTWAKADRDEQLHELNRHLPVLGFSMIPLGLALLALDLPFLRSPLAQLLGYINRKLAAT